MINPSRVKTMTFSCLYPWQFTGCLAPQTMSSVEDFLVYIRELKTADLRTTLHSLWTIPVLFSMSHFNNSCQCLHVPGAVLRTSHVSAHWIPTTALWGRYCYEPRNWDAEKLSTLPKVAQLVSNEVQQSGSKSPCSYGHFYTILPLE